MLKVSWVLTAGLGLLVLAGCERPSAIAPRGSDETSRPSSSAYTSETDRSGSGNSTSDGPVRTRVQDAPVRQLNGKPIWSASRKGSAEENAQRSFQRNGEAFGARSLDDYIRKAQSFTSQPPSGTERLERTNGDVLLYNAKTNVFAVMTADGAPRALFKPDDGPAYWASQKAQVLQRQTARADRRSGQKPSGGSDLAQ
jgi:pyocin large subunit-like protein